MIGFFLMISMFDGRFGTQFKTVFFSMGAYSYTSLQVYQYVITQIMYIYLIIQILVISPQNLGSDLLLMLSQTRLRHLHILQNHYTPVDIELMTSCDWIYCTKTNPTLRVHLRVESIRERQILWQTGAPVSSVIYKSPNIRVGYKTHIYILYLYTEASLTILHNDAHFFFVISTYLKIVTFLWVHLVCFQYFQCKFWHTYEKYCFF